MSEDKDPALVEKARKLFSGPCDFFAAAQTLDWLPEATLPEVAFAGRSNVGKSSLINALTNRNALARTSQTPGRTQQLNFFNLGDVFHLVDMPGHGYAKVSKSKISLWQRLIKKYLEGRPTLRCVFILIDARHGVKDSDRQLMTMLDRAAVPFRIVFTKTDKAGGSREKWNAILQKDLEKHPAAFPEPLYTSALKKKGLEDLRETILEVCA